MALPTWSQQFAGKWSSLHWIILAGSMNSILHMPSSSCSSPGRCTESAAHNKWQWHRHYLIKKCSRFNVLLIYSCICCSTAQWNDDSIWVHMQLALLLMLNRFRHHHKPTDWTAGLIILVCLLRARNRGVLQAADLFLNPAGMQLISRHHTSCACMKRQVRWSLLESSHISMFQ